MKSPFLKFINDDINTPNTPFYKRKLFLIGMGFLSLILIIVIIIIIIVAVTPSSFSSNSFIESKESIKNPDQGYYSPIYITITPDTFVHKYDNDNNLFHLRCDISQFSSEVNSDKKDKKLTETALNNIDNYLKQLKSQNKNAIIRFTYAPGYGSDKDKEPDFSMIEEHIKQLSKIMNKYIDTLTAIEAGMLGPWGEMHSSKIATQENCAKVFKLWLENTKEIPILGRYPRSLFTYFNKTVEEMANYTISKNDIAYRLGLFNDCFLSSDNDVGTYKKRENEMEWISTINTHLPFGDEVCKDYYLSDLENALPEMNYLSISYLNDQFNKSVTFDKWKNVKYNSTLGKDSLFYGVTGYDYISAHIGYRFVIKSIDVKYKKGGKFDLTINIKNVGFGNLLKTKKVDIIYANMTGGFISRNKVGVFKGENSIKVSGKFLEKDHQDYQVFICLYGSIENNIVYYPIQFANDNIYNKNLTANLLFTIKKGGKLIK